VPTSNDDNPQHPSVGSDFEDAYLISGETPSLVDVERVARAEDAVALTESARQRIAASRAGLTAVLEEGRAIYGVNTGFGSLARRRVEPHQLVDVQHNLIRSHAAGVGEPLPNETVRAMMLLLACSLARGYSGIRLGLVEAISGLLNSRITPVVPETGSVGASGDLAPLAHVALVLLGEGEATTPAHDKPIPGGQALKEAGLTPIELGPKEGLALINGTHLMAAQAALALIDAQRVVDAAIVAAAMSIDANRATDTFLDSRVYQTRNHWGPSRVATRLRQLLDGSQIIPSHRDGDPRVQDPYSLRCAGYVIGAALTSLDSVYECVDAELGAVTDNPLVFSVGAGASAQVISAGNFHGLPIALPLDHLTIALTHVAGIAERRVFLMLAASDPQNPLHPHLSVRPGVESGLMITQYTAAACCNQLIALASPASVVNIPTCAGMEDYNSFGPTAALQARRAVSLAADVVAIELLCAAEALEYQRPLTSGHGVEHAHAAIRSVVPRLESDRSPAPDIAAIKRLVLAGRFR
jgi:histidine ammonia-lyase